MLTRRDLLKTAALAMAPLGCAGVPVVEGRAADRVALGLSLDLEEGIEAALSRFDLSWLSRGDSVLLKVACNSGNRHPAVTSPRAIVAMCRALRARGAGRVLVGDQSGVMMVRRAAGDRRFSSTRALMEGNGLLAAIEEGGGEPHFFDDRAFDDGYVEARLPSGATAWPSAPRIARVVTEVDHVVYLPRLAAHCITGYTHGHKLVIGFMRDDTRHAMHADGGALYEKYVELNYAAELQARLRLVVTAVERVLVEGGPDDGDEALCAPAIVLASEHLANHDAVSVALLGWAREHLPRGAREAAVPYGPWAGGTNLGLLAAVEPATGIPWRSDGAFPSAHLPHDFDAGASSDRALTHAYRLLGGAPRSIDVDVMGAGVPDALARRLERTTASPRAT